MFRKPVYVHFTNKNSRGSSAYFCVSDEVVVVPNERFDLHKLVVKKSIDSLHVILVCMLETILMLTKCTYSL